MNTKIMAGISVEIMIIFSVVIEKLNSVRLPVSGVIVVAVSTSLFFVIGDKLQQFGAYKYPYIVLTPSKL